MLETNALVRRLSINNSKLLTLSDENIKDIQAVLLDMMADFDAFCRKNGLSYFLCGGSALGAQRHGGFIPWDDDMDVAMPRADYVRMRELFLAEYGDRYWVQSITDGSGYNLPFMKLRKKGTRYVEIFETDPDQAGIFIDIYPLENLPDVAPARLLHGVVCDFLHFCCSCVRVNCNKRIYLNYFGNLRAVKVKALLGKCLGIIPLKTWCRLADRVASSCKNEQSKFVSFPSGRKHYFGEMLHRASVLPPKECTFNGHLFFEMSNPAEHLETLYGDFTAIPKQHNREQHSILTLDLGVNNEQILL
ncbi:MAG: LicD family protein [Clostridia bacterium]|nr:LicD family protein [Clostridia bacterium]